MDSFAGDEVGGPVAGRADDLTVDVAGGTGRERDSAELPESMRRDVRLLGEVLGEVISESAGADLLAKTASAQITQVIIQLLSAAPVQEAFQVQGKKFDFENYIADVGFSEM